MKKWQKIAQIIIYLLVIFFILRIFFTYWSNIRLSLIKINISYILLSILCFSLSFLILSLVWYQIIKPLGKIRLIESLFIYYKSQIIRYIPGNIWGYGARIYFFKKVGFISTQIFFSFIYESFLLCFSSIFTYFIFRYFLAAPFYLDTSLAIIGFFILLVLINHKIFFLLFKIFRRDDIVYYISLKRTAIYIIQYFFYWLLCGFGLYFIILAFTPLAFDKIWAIIIIYAAAWVIGYLSLITPSGLGVRELSLIFLLPKIVVHSLVGLLAVFSRLISIIGELLGLFIFYLLRWRMKKDINNLPSIINKI